MDTSVVMQQMLQLFLCIALGYMLAKIKMMSGHFTQDISKFVINVSMPAMILASLYKTNTNKVLPFQDICIASIVLVVLLPFVAFFFIKLARIKEHQGLLMFMMMYPNVGFMGFPLIEALLGSEAVLSTAMINMGFNISLFTLGVVVINYKAERKVKLNRKEVISPGVIASLLVIVLYALNISIPPVIGNTLMSIGNMTTPLAMLIIGATLANYAFKDIFKEGRDYVYVLFLNLVLPILFYPLLAYSLHDPMIEGIALIILAMPIANSVVIFAKLYKQDEFFAAKMLFVSTLFSVVSIPFIIRLFLV